MKKILFGALIALAAVLVVRSCADEREQKSILEENTMLIQQELKNVSKLIVTEGYFVEVYNYKDLRCLKNVLVQYRSYLFARFTLRTKLKSRNGQISKEKKANF